MTHAQWFYLMLGIAVLYYGNLQFRARQISLFLLTIQLDCVVYNERHDMDDGYENAFEWFFYALPPYSRMLVSLRPLKVERWMPKELIDKLYA